MRIVRLWLRKFLIRCFGKFGEKIILPKVRYYYDRLPLLDYRTKRYAASEARIIRSEVANPTTKYTIVYDCKVTGLAYGSLLNFLAIARYVIAYDKCVEFILVNAGHPLDDGTRESEEIEFLIADFTYIAKSLLNSELSEVILMQPEDLLEHLDGRRKKTILFEEFTRNRRPFFRDVYNVFNCLMTEIDDYRRKQVLFSSNEFKDYYPTAFCPGPYISWHCRYSLRGVDFGRQTLEDEFVASYEYLKFRFPDHQIIIVSDSLGCDHYSALAVKLQITDLHFSKDYSRTFLGDAALVMASDFFYWFRGGGIGNIALLSNMPYEMLGPLMNAIMLEDNMISAWQEKWQKFVVLEKHQFVSNRRKDIARIGESQLT
jgi:hypothetical protein